MNYKKYQLTLQGLFTKLGWLANIHLSGRQPDNYKFEFDYKYGSGEAIEKFAKKNISDLFPR